MLPPLRTGTGFFPNVVSMAELAAKKDGLSVGAT